MNNKEITISNGDNFNQIVEKDKIELENCKLDLPGWMEPIIDQIIKINEKQ